MYEMSLVKLLRKEIEEKICDKINVAIYAEKSFVGIPQGCIKITVIYTKFRHSFHGIPPEFFTEFHRNFSWYSNVKIPQYFFTEIQWNSVRGIP